MMMKLFEALTLVGCQQINKQQHRTGKPVTQIAAQLRASLAIRGVRLYFTLS